MSENLTNGLFTQGNALDLLSRVRPKSIDAIITDPPYGCTHNKWDVRIDLQLFWERILPCLKPNAAICIFSQQPFTTDLIVSNRKMFRYDIVWSKQLQVGFLNAKKMPLRTHEHICVFYGRLPVYNPQMHYRDKPSWRDKGRYGSVNYNQYANLPHTGQKDGSRYPGSIVYVDYEPLFFKKNESPRHPTQKPVDIMKYLVKTYTNPGDTVLDPFMGSGTTGVAALQLGRRFIGFEQESEYCDIACKRLDDARHASSLLA